MVIANSINGIGNGKDPVKLGDFQEREHLPAATCECHRAAMFVHLSLSDEECAQTRAITEFHGRQINDQMLDIGLA